MKLTFCGGAKSVTGACYLLEINKTKILVDCGLFQGGRVAEKANYQSFSFRPKDIDYVLITHGHLDHVGRLPKLYRDGFQGAIFSTYPTRDFTELILYDSYGILSKEAKVMKLRSIYDMNDVRGVMALFKGVDYGESINLTGDISCGFKDAGHVLGSAIIEIAAEGKKVVFSGDLGNSPSSLLKPTEFAREADYLIMESIYGDKIHETQQERSRALERFIEDAVARRGVIMLPAFAIERTQEILYELNELVENNRIPSTPIFLDSPLSIEATAIYKRYPRYYSKGAQKLIESGDALFNFPGLRLTRTRTESKEINNIAGPKMIIAGSGMLEGGRIWHHLRRYLSDSKNLLLIVSYQAPGSLGRKLLDGAAEVELFQEKIPVRAEIRHLSGYSAHADQAQLLRFVSQAKKSLKKVFVVQGEEEASTELAGLIRDRLGVAAEVPEVGDSVKL